MYTPRKLIQGIQMELSKIEKTLTSMYSQRFFLFYFVALTWLPVTSALAEPSGAQVTPFISAITMYRVEAIIIASIFTLVLGALLSTRYEPPIDVPSTSRMDTLTTFLFAIAGGVGAFIYGLEQEKTLTVLHPLWVLGVSIVTPSFVQVAFPVIVKIWYKFVKSKEGTHSND